MPDRPDPPALQASHFLRQVEKAGFGFSDEGSVEEGGEGMGVSRRRTAGYHDGVALPSLGRTHGDQAGFKDRDYAGSGKLITEGKPQDIDIAERDSGLQGIKRNPPPREQGLEIGSGREYPLGPDERRRVQARIEDPNGVIGHADLIEVREAEGDGQ